MIIWRPIAEAPKNGTTVLLWHPGEMLLWADPVPALMGHWTTDEGCWASTETLLGNDFTHFSEINAP